MLTSFKPLICRTALTIAASVCLNGALAQAATLVWGNNSGNLTWDTTSANWGDGVTLYNNATPDSVTFGVVSPAANQTITVASGLKPGSVTFNNVHQYTMNGNGWGGSGTLTKNGTGRLVIDGVSTFTGGTIINQGTVFVNSSSHGFGGLLGPVGSQNITVASGAILDGSRSGFSGTLTLNGGTWTGGNGFGDSWTGPVILGADSTIAGRSHKRIHGVVSGPGGITRESDNGGGQLTLNGVNTYTGDTLINRRGTINLPDNAGLLFDIGAAGVNNQIASLDTYGAAGPGIVNLLGDFTFDLTGASREEGDTWNIVDIASLSANFGSTFTVNGFADIGNNQWQSVFGGTTFIFSEATGLLVVVPEPSSFALLGLASLGLVGYSTHRRRKRRAA